MIAQNFNGGWSFKKADGSSLGVMSNPERGTHPVCIPHDAMVYEERAPEVANGMATGFYPGGNYVYVKRFVAPDEWKEKTVTIEFEGVYKNALVYLNGRCIAANSWGYTGFYAKLDNYLNYGEDNLITVLVDNSASPNSRWYSGSGIYRNINLYVGELTHFVLDSIQVYTRDIGSEVAIIELEADIENSTHDRISAVVETVVLDQNGGTVSEEKTPVTLFPADNEHVRQSICIRRPHLWDCEDPYLYKVETRLVTGENNIPRTLDYNTLDYGIRKISIDPVRGMLLNGNPIKLRGSCIHHDNGIIGAATFQSAEDRKVKLLKQAGFNSLRSSHHPASPELLNACDRQGMLVIDELSDMWTYHKNWHDDADHFSRDWKEAAERMIYKDFNHASVFMYSVGNEIPEVGMDQGAAISRKISNFIHALDPDRYISAGINGNMAVTYTGGLFTVMKKVYGDRLDLAGGGVNALNALMGLTAGEVGDRFAMLPELSEKLDESVSTLDVIGYNYLTGRYLLEEKLHPNKAIVGMETYPADIWRLWDLVKNHNHILGDFTWTGYDYLGEAGCGIFHYDGAHNFSVIYPERAAYIGDIDLTGYRRPISYYREIVYGLRREPYIAVVRMNHDTEPSKTAWMFKDNIASWTWPGYEGKKVSIDVYTVDEEVELYLNDKLVGKKKLGKSDQFIATFEIPYVPGTLKAVTYAGGKKSGEFSLRSAVGTPRIHIETDKTEIKSNNEDLAFLNIQLTDEYGTPDLFDKKLISVKISGPAVLQGLGSANPSCEGNYYDTSWETFDGGLLAVIRATNDPGEIVVTCSAEDENAQIKLNSVNWR